MSMLKLGKCDLLYSMMSEGYILQIGVRFFSYIALLIICSAPILQAQSLSLIPFYGLQSATCRLADHAEGYASFSARNGMMGANMGLLLEYKSKGAWGVMSGVTVGVTGMGFKVSYQNLPSGTYMSGINQVHGGHRELNRIPVLGSYTWKKVKLFQLRNFRKLPEKKRSYAVDESLFYLLLFKVQPVFGMNIDYFGQTEQWNTDSTNLFYTTTDVIKLYRPVYELRRVNVSAVLGARLQFYHFGKDRLAISILYYQGLRDLLEMSLDYSVAEEAYHSSIRTRGGGLSVTLSYPIRLFNFDKEARELQQSQ